MSEETTCSKCNWSNTSLLNVSSQGETPRWLCHGCISLELKRLDAAATPICIGEPIITHLANDGQWVSEKGGAVIAADGLFKNNPYDRIRELETEVTRLKEQLRQFHVGEVIAPAGDHALSREVANHKDEEIKFLKSKLQSDRKIILLKAAYDLLKQHNEAHFVESAMETTVFYDEAECDGSCLMDDIKAELGIKD